MSKPKLHVVVASTRPGRGGLAVGKWFEGRTREHTKRWSALIDAADAFVFVTPEYDYGMPATLLNALQVLFKEWNYKPVGYVSYGGVSGGTRGVQMSKLVVTSLRMMPIPEAVSIPFYTKLVEDGVFKGDATQDAPAKTMLDELLRWTNALRVLRA